MITVETTVRLPVDAAWRLWTEPQHITQWNHASDDWHSPHAENDPKTNGRFRTTMAARDGSAQFDFEGTYTNVVDQELIEYVIDDGRKVKVTFTPDDEGTRIIEMFEAETLNPEDVQKAGWQAILDNFRAYAERGQ